MAVVEAFGRSGVTYYVNDDGSMTRAEGGTINLRNNNPGNIRYGDYAKSMGAIGESNGFAIFPDMTTGTNAQTTLLKSDGYQNAPAAGGYPEGSVGAAIYRWAPPNENDSGSYVRSVERKMGVSADTPMKDLTSTQLENMRQAMANHEGSGSPDWVPMGTMSDEELLEVKAANDLAQRRSPTNSYLSSPYLSNNFSSMIGNQSAYEFIENGAFYEGNVLDDYDNPTYHIKFWMIGPEDFEEFTNLQDWEERRNFIYRPEVYRRSALLYESGVTTEWGITNVTMDSTLGMDSKTRKSIVSKITMDVIEPNGCRFFDVITMMSRRLGWKSTNSQPYLLEISWVGYTRMNNPNGVGGAQQVVQFPHRQADGTTRLVDCRQLYCLCITNISSKFSHAGFQYRISATPADHLAYNKEYYNTKGPIEYDRGVISLRTFLAKLQEAMNQQMANGSGKTLIEENLISEDEFFEFNYVGEDDPTINLAVIESAGESAGKSAKFIIAPGKSVAQIIDQICRVLKYENNKAVTIEDSSGAEVYKEFPKLLQVESKLIYRGESQKTGQKAYKIIYNVYPYYLSRLKWNNSKDYETIAKYTLEALYSNGFVFKKRYDYVFTSKNSQVISVDYNIDLLWRCYSYDLTSENYNDTSGNVLTPNQSSQPQMSLANGVEYKNNSLSLGSGKDSLLSLVSNKPSTMSSIPMMTTIEEAAEQLRQLNLSDVSTSDIIGSLKEPTYTGIDTYVQEADYVTEDDSMFTPDNSNRSDIKNASIFNQIYEQGNAISLKMTIRGDPYWIIDDTDSVFRGENSIYFKMKTPSLRQSGDNPDLAADEFGGGTEDVHTLCGIYNVISITHKFSKGQFTQEINGVLSGNFRFPV